MKSSHVEATQQDTGSFTLTETDSGTDSDSDSKPGGYIVLCRTFHIAQTWTLIPTPYFCTGQESESVSGNVNEPSETLQNGSSSKNIFSGSISPRVI